jgi:hypothetical protein
VDLNRDLAAAPRPQLDAFRRLTRDLYVAAGDVAFWQGAYRDPAEPEFAEVSERITSAERVVIDLLYGDHLGSQRMISRFSLVRRGDEHWQASVSRHWNVDRPDPR